MEIIQRVVKDSLPISDDKLQIDCNVMAESDLLSSVVLKFSSKATQETIDWLIALIEAPGKILLDRISIFWAWQLDA